MYFYYIQFVLRYMFLKKTHKIVALFLLYKDINYLDELFV